jgi:uncharacterized metal-binding protein YceD (DUF177 family)
MTMPDPIRVADLSSNATKNLNIRPDADAIATLRDALGLSGLRKLTLVGNLSPMGKKDWRLTAKLGATVVQPCVVSLEPVTTRIDVEVERNFIAGLTERAAENDEEEIEIPEDDTYERLGPEIDLAAILTESLAMALPQYPRLDGAHLDESVFAAPGITPMKDEDARPFAGLSALRDQLGGD